MILESRPQENPELLLSNVLLNTDINLLDG